ncbi:MAG TPA: hypothetical protein VEF04_08975, partial [Blastocatellia bacterium]|nr:hypothetical protein [Blastocatellia bacterium]
MQRFMQKVAIASFGILAFFASATNALAFVQFNNDPQDFATFRTLNSTQCPNCTSWALSTTANPGDTISFDLYYHNTGSEAASNVRLKVTPSSTAVSNVHQITGTILASNMAGTVSGTASVYLSQAQSMSYIPGSATWFPNQSTTGQPIADSTLSTTGISIGTVAAGWPSQGHLRIKYKVGQAT